MSAVPAVLASAKRAVVSVLRQIHFDRNHDTDKTIFLAGSGRGGTTWIAEIINYTNNYRFIFEPFFADKVPVCRHFRNRQYIRPDDADPRFLQPATSVLSGRLHSRWSDYYNRRLISSRRLVKDIRANLFLKWIRRHFPTIPIVLLLRHPFAVVHSRTVLNWHDDLTDFLDQPQLMANHLDPFKNCMMGAVDAFDRHLIRWCVENFVPLNQFRAGEVHLAFYEQFCTDPKAAVGGLFDYLNIPVHKSLFGRMGRPSSQLYADRPHAGWQKTITPAKMKRGLEILNAFGLDRIYSAEGMPDMASAQNMLGGNR
ncbi:MAG: sulfotransferase [Candidatus Eremiobacteraeota bacterium]|nr:sulfotransferase [Candidatus Eremiobacteraeota bacterium]